MAIKKSFILVHLDDDPLELKRFARIFKVHSAVNNFEIHSFTHSQEFLKFISNTPQIDFCILDIILSLEEKIDGLSLIEQMKTYHPQSVIVMSSFNDHPYWILKALSLQADDFFSKKIWPENIVERLMQIYQHAQIKTGRLNVNSLFELKNKSLLNDGYALCAGKTLKAVENRVQLILRSAIRCILIEGESGTGKEVVADIFEHYHKSCGPFVRLNCASLAQNLLESELFGHKKGAFTGALQDKVGFIESSHKGFLFLDEISSLSCVAQAALLRAIENQEVVRLGETHPRKVNVRFICATNVSLQERVEKNLFRKDLWQRLREVDIYLPPLHTRKDEIPELIDFICAQFQEHKYAVDPLAKQVLSALDWRDGNVRELRNTLRAMTEFAQNGILGIGAIPSRIFANMSAAPMLQQKIHYTQQEHDTQIIALNALNAKSNGSLDEIKIPMHSPKENRAFTYAELCEELFQQLIKHHMQQNKKLNVSKLAKELRISRTTLLAKIKHNKT